MAEQAFSRAAGALLVGGNAIELLVDARANFDAWLSAIRAAQSSILFENYIFSDDPLGREFRDALTERASAGVRVRVIRDWLGCVGNSARSYWKSLVDAGGEVRAYNPPRLDSPLGWLSRDHRKLLVVDGASGFVSGICVAEKWLGNPARGIDPWRDTGVAIRGPANADIARAFADVWMQLGTPLHRDLHGGTPANAGDITLRIVATQPSTASLFRLDQLIAAMARRTLWLTDAYFVAMPPYVQALCAAARDGVDVRLLVPGTSNLHMVARLSHAGYRPLLAAGVRVYEWNGSMLHAKTAVADARWARVGSSNLNLASSLGNCEIDVAVEDEGFARQVAGQYETDLSNATEIVLLSRFRVTRNSAQPRDRRRMSGSSSRVAAGALRLAYSLGAAMTGRRVLGRAEASILPGAALTLAVLGALGLWWPKVIAWPLAVLALWISAALLTRYLRLRRESRQTPAGKPAPPDQC